MNDRHGKPRNKTSMMLGDATFGGGYILGLRPERVMVRIINLLDQGLQALAPGRLHKH